MFTPQLILLRPRIAKLAKLLLSPVQAKGLVVMYHHSYSFSSSFADNRKQGFATSFAKTNPKGIVLIARSAEALDVVTKEIRAINGKIEVLAIPTDVLNGDSVAALWEKVKAKFGHADILINNAGTMNGSGPISEAPADA